MFGLPEEKTLSYFLSNATYSHDTSTSQTDRRTDAGTTYDGNTALCNI